MSNLMDLPVEILTGVVEYVCERPTDYQAIKLRRARELKAAWASPSMPPWKKPFTEWYNDIYNRSRTQLGAAQQMVVSSICTLRLINNLFSEIGAQQLVRYSHSPEMNDPAIHACFCLTLSLETNLLEKFLAIAKNPTLARAVRSITVNRYPLQLVTLSRAEFDVLYDQYMEHRCYNGPYGFQHGTFSVAAIGPIGDDFVPQVDEYTQYCMLNEKKRTSFHRLLFDNQSELVTCIQNLTAVQILTIKDVNSTLNDLRICQLARNANSLIDHQHYCTMLPEAFLKAGVSVGNMLRDSRGGYACLTLLDHDINRPVNVPPEFSWATSLCLEAIAGEHSYGADCPGWFSLLQAMQNLERLTLSDEFSNGENEAFSALCNNILVNTKPLEKMYQITLRNVRISLPMLADLVIQPTQPTRHSRTLKMLNVKADDRADWRVFLDRLKTSPIFGSSIPKVEIILCPHPDLAEGVSEWDSIRDIVAAYPRRGVAADISAYVSL